MSTGLSVVVLDAADGAGRRRVVTLPGEEYGYAIARWFDEADRISAALGTTPLSTFVYEDVELYEAALEMADAAGDGDFGARMRAKLEAARRQPEWHDPADGLDAVRGVLEEVRGGGSRVDEAAARTTADAVLRDLETVAGLLADAAAHGRRFRFEAL